VQALVTGGAGFIGSHLAERLVEAGHRVRVVDVLTDYYDVDRKRANLAELRRVDDAGDRVEVVEVDLCAADLPALLDGVDVVFHQAGQPGVRLSWADGFAAYDRMNILATQRLLEACRQVPVQRLVFASSSSVYGDAERFPTREADAPAPRSPYGVTKLAAEYLCRAYADNFAVPAVLLRYFTVYGPRQRPDMAFHRLIDAALGGDPFPMFGDGSQVREFTFVDDVVRANLAAAVADVAPGEVVNISGGSAESLADMIALVEELVGAPVPIEHRGPAAGDARRTGGDIEKASRLLGWHPEVAIREGMAAQVAWHRLDAAARHPAPR
jgi:UDP-glucuronate 4-epimerase